MGYCDYITDFAYDSGLFAYSSAFYLHGQRIVVVAFLLSFHTVLHISCAYFTVDRGPCHLEREAQGSTGSCRQKRASSERSGETQLVARSQLEWRWRRRRRGEKFVSGEKERQQFRRRKEKWEQKRKTQEERNAWRRGRIARALAILVVVVSTFFSEPKFRRRVQQWQKQRPRYRNY